MNTIQKFDTIHQYNEFLGQETLHPLVNVINLAQSCRLRHGLHSFGFYTVFLKEIKCGNLRYGCNYYDYQEGTLVFLAPGQVIGVEDDGKVYQPQGMALVFHPDLLRGTTLGRTIKDYTFFSYQVNEALHLSEQERHIIIDCFRNIEEELHHPALGGPPGQDGHGGKIGPEHKIALLHLHKTGNGAAVKADTILHGFGQVAGKHGDVFLGAKDIAEGKADEFDVVVLHKIKDVLLGIIAHSGSLRAAGCGEWHNSAKLEKSACVLKKRLKACFVCAKQVFRLV